MIPRQFQYVAPSSLKDAVSLLREHGEDAKILAGGQSLIPLMKLRLMSARYLVDINHIPKLSYIKEEKDIIKIGALTRHAEIGTSKLMKSKLPIMLDAASVVADPIVRNVGTIGGALAHADPSGDWGAIVLALGAELVAVGPRGERRIKAGEFFVDTFTTRLGPTEILTGIRIPSPRKKSGGAYLKLERKVGDFAIVGVADQVTLGDGGICAREGIGLAGAGPKPIKATLAEKALIGKRMNDESIKKAAKISA
jgi:carbon-monoxide dehydrogenase medium subunit